jgi:hypothetical protein
MSVWLGEEIQEVPRLKSLESEIGAEFPHPTKPKQGVVSELRSLAGGFHTEFLKSD